MLILKLADDQTLNVVTTLYTTRFSNGDSRVLFSPPYSVKTTSLPHTPNDLFDQIWRKGVVLIVQCKHF